jgi:ribosomal protein S18 acetylase RimI-like enzyme
MNTKISNVKKKSIEWIKNNGGSKIIIGVAAGNENAFNFYARYGFYPKVTILEQL